jgi:hypothetical protein
MLRRKSPVRTGLLLLAVCALAAGCASEYVKVAPAAPEKYEMLGKAKGSACGSLLIDGTAYNFIPVMLNSRVERAYDDAVKSVSGATSLIYVTMQEDWFWWVIGSTKCVTITGEAIR